MVEYESPLPFRIEDLAWDKQDGLLPAVVQDATTLRVLMLGYMDRAALEATRASGRVTFFSRSKRRLWTKGESSGHWLELVAIHADCDGDALLVLARPRGPTCHRGTPSCFGEAPADAFAALDAVIAERAAKRPPESYTARLLAAGTARIAQKVGEEGVEVALAAVTGEAAALGEEAADLVYHLAVLLHVRGSSLAEVGAVLQARHQGDSKPSFKIEGSGA
jgi:phosphoribosyl-ATP pyrophosphohydrolase/phosphoribosyl-AMP cyclohydrolase